MGMSEVRQFQTRRNFFRTQAGGIGAALLAGAGVEIITPPRLPAQTQLDPEGALAELLAGNKRYISRQMTSLNEDLAILRQNTAEKQEPFAAVLSCADSRVPVEIIFDQSIGE